VHDATAVALRIIVGLSKRVYGLVFRGNIICLSKGVYGLVFRGLMHLPSLFSLQIHKKGRQYLQGLGFSSTSI